MARRRRARRARRSASRVRSLVRAAGWMALGCAALLATWLATLPPDDLVATLEGAPRTLAEQPARALRRIIAARGGDGVDRMGRHLGFDTYRYPGDEAMRRWKRAAPYEWVGYYLPAPCHPDTSWSGTRERLEAMGWGLAVLYVGQQAWDQNPAPVRRGRRTTRPEEGPTCHEALVHADRGRADGEDAVRRTVLEGFPNGTAIFLDVEYMERTPREMRAYVRAWTRAVLADGRFRPGAYVHARNARIVHADIAREYGAAGVPGAVPMWVAGGRGFHRRRAPHEVGHDFAVVWQGELDRWETWDGIRLPIDVNVASVPSPSSHRFAPARTSATPGD